MLLLITTQMVPAIVLAIPVFLTFNVYLRDLGLYDTVTALVIVNVAFSLPIVIWLMRNVLEEVPRSLESAARIDGCSRIGTIFRVLFPAAAPGIAAVAILMLIGTWNEFLFAVMLGDREAVTITRLVSRIDVRVGPGESPPFSVTAAAGVLAVLPAVLMVFMFHRRIVAGLARGGGVKG
jgi:multiple sugar transport system permease protein